MPSLYENELTSSRMMLAKGAMAWTHSMSSVVSSDVSLLPPTGEFGVPGCLTTVKVGSPLRPSSWGRPYWVEKTERSLAAVGRL